MSTVLPYCSFVARENHASVEIAVSRDRVGIAPAIMVDDELTIDAARCDSERNLSLAFVDDKHAHVAYDDVKWSKASAEAYIEELMKYSEAHLVALLWPRARGGARGTGGGRSLPFPSEGRFVACEKAKGKRRKS